MSRSRSLLKLALLGVLFMVVALLTVRGPSSAAIGQEPAVAAPLLSDEAFVFHPSLAEFNVADALRAANSGLLGYEETLDGRTVGAAETVEAIAREYSLSPKLLLALLEWRGGLVSALASDPAAVDYAFGSPTAGLAAQLDAAARPLFDAFYAYRAAPDRASEMPNAATAALAALPVAGRLASAADAADFVAVYTRLFGDPLHGQLILAAPTSPMPGARLPWTAGQAWNYNGGPHNNNGGTFGCEWGTDGCPSGPWSSVDFGPMDRTALENLCGSAEGEKYSAWWAVAARGGTVSHGSTTSGTVIVDHGDGWSTYYTHLSLTGKVAPGPIDQGEAVGHPSCQGNTTGIHLHFAVNYQGAFVDIDGTNLGGWNVTRTTHYNGRMTCPDGRRQVADTARLTTSRIEDNCRPPAAAQLSVVLIIDSTGSMSDNDPNRLRVQAAKAFIDAAQPGDEIGIVDFETTARTLAPMTLIHSAAEKDLLKSAVDNVREGGLTNINAGLNGGFAALSSAIGATANRVAILLTDGDHNVGAYSDNSHLQYAAQNWPIYTIGLGQANQELLRRIATATGGECANNCQALADAALLGQIYQALRAQLTNSTTITSAQLLVQQGEQHFLSANVMPNQFAAQFYIGWQGSEMELTLTGPGGRVIDPTHLGPDVAHAKGATYELYTLNFPERGMWNMAINGLEAPPGGELVTAYASSLGISYLYNPITLDQPTPTPPPTPPPTIPPTAQPTPTNTPRPEPPPPTATPTVPACANIVANSGFEENAAWQINVNEFPAAYWWGFGHSGSRSMRIGIPGAADNRYSYSSAQQTVVIPSPLASARLGYWLYPQTSETVAALTPPPVVPTSSGDRAKLSDDAQMVLLLHGAGQQTVLRFMRENPGRWVYYEHDLSAFRGQAVTLYFGVFNDGWGGVTAMWADDVTLNVCR